MHSLSNGANHATELSPNGPSPVWYGLSYNFSSLVHWVPFCRESTEYSPDGADMSEISLKSASGKARIDMNKRQVDLLPASKITLHVEVGGREVEMLYDPGSTYGMITRGTYTGLKVCPPIFPVTKTGVGVSGGTNVMAQMAQTLLWNSNQSWYHRGLHLLF